MIDIPLHVWVLGQRLSIVGKPRFKSPDDDLGKTTFADGYLDWKASELCYQLGHDDQWTRELVLHEILHAVDFAMDDDSQYGDSRRFEVKDIGDSKYVMLPEEQVKKRSRVLFTILTDPRNQPFVRWLVGDRALVLGGNANA